LPSAAFADPKTWPEGALPVDILLQAKNAELSHFSIALPVPIRSAGALSGSARLRYDLRDKAPTLSGALSLNRGSLGIAPLGQQLSDVEARLAFERNTIRVQRLSMHDFGGSFESSGEIVLDTLSKARLELGLTFGDFPIRNEGAQVSKLSGKLALRAEVDAKKTRAELTVKDLRVNLPGDLGLGLQDLDPHPGIEVIGEEPPPPPEAPHVFELRVLAQKPPFRVLRSDLNAEVFTDLTARYENPKLTLEGSAELKRGNFELYGRRFELQESRLSFDHADQLDPLVSLYATHKIGSDEIGIRVEGRLSAPKISFTHSNPAITDTGTIIAALLGVRSGDPTVQNADPSGAAAGMLAGATAGLLTERVRRALGGAVPVISMDPSGPGLRTTRIRAGLQLDQVIEKRLGNLRKIVRGAYVEGFVAPGAGQTDDPNVPPQSRGGGLLELRFPADMVGSVEYRPIQNWRVDVAWEP
jgi:autotransporter translocation and assembly factor TamB